ncbi:hypothetical protein FOCG_08812 [Fusarium oxysporum f. sp. radicis-lycopersici 26381]|uniref:Uncharacterized protein n=1 Tax=Fusarium oxysporum f. sp. melonis 26406 TaxID=1089452 RepID=W9ZID0_FUSOX|nr:hypothetical protein FOMG_15486 [Fusarium oxysporum f. sp. melonis 26406]EXL50535.1 hypothetical protein FOCG_08812 [Fusarium oxysporum f. sp. radicis-lycopersici 26381]KAJ0134433.1 Uncharacterized protein HZ326_22518 [Fusarium oxysporum f. sp. albedinis]
MYSPTKFSVRGDLGCIAGNNRRNVPLVVRLMVCFTVSRERCFGNRHLNAGLVVPFLLSARSEIHRVFTVELQKRERNTERGEESLRRLLRHLAARLVASLEREG